MKAEDFKTSKKVGESLFKGAAFHKNDGSEMPTPAQPTESKATVKQKNEMNPLNDWGQNVQFDELDDVDKQCYALAAKSYNGNIDPKQWAMYWSQKDSLPLDRLIAPAQYIYNYVHANNLMSAEQIEEDKYPWWSAARNWDPNAIGAWGKKVSDAFTPSNAMINALTPRF